MVSYKSLFSIGNQVASSQVVADGWANEAKC